MNIEFLTLTEETNVRCAIRVKAPKDVSRISTHFILLLDISGSMEYNNKLEHVKKCCHLIVDLLNDADHLSLITFGSESTICLQTVPVTIGNKEHIHSVISALRTDGCTNMSAGLLNVRTVLEGTTQKAGLLVLTDGLANRGMIDPSAICDISASLLSEFSNLSIHTIGYGTDHNADLLKQLAVQSQGSYNIVNTIDDTALAFGDVLGGLMSCAYQNVSVAMPVDAKLYGPYTNENGCVSLGDVYAGTSPTLIFDMKRADLALVSIKGVSCSDFKPFRQDASWIPLAERDKDIELCFLRYECSDIMKELSSLTYTTASRNPVGTYQTITSRIDKLYDSLQDAFFSGESLKTLLISETSILRLMLANILNNQQTQENRSILSQHSACLGLARGFSSPMPPQRSSNPVNYSSPPPIHRLGAQAHLSMHTDPDTPHAVEDPIFQNPLQRAVSMGLRTATQGM